MRGKRSKEDVKKKRMRGNEIGGGRVMQGSMRRIENSEMCMAMKEEIKKINCMERVEGAEDARARNT